MERIWNYGGREYSFDITEAGCVFRVTKALATLKKDTEVWEKRWLEASGDSVLADSSMVSEHCRSLRRFFDILFGDGEGDVITGGSDSAEICDVAYLDFLCFVQMQIEAFSRIREEIEARYRERLEKMAGRHSQTMTEQAMAEGDGDGNSH